jgi:hypothetical protein
MRVDALRIGSEKGTRVEPGVAGANPGSGASHKVRQAECRRRFLAGR